jgi:hypothetical protein
VCYLCTTDGKKKQLTGERENLEVKEQSEPISNETTRFEKGDLQLDILTSKKEKHELSSRVIFIGEVDKNELKTGALSW